MSITPTITFTFSPDDVKKIIVKHLADTGYKVKPEDVIFDVGSELRCYDRGEYPVYMLRKCSVVVKGE